MDNLKKFTVIGNGSWGTALAKILTDNGHHIHWWLRDKIAAEHLQKRGHNLHYLTSVPFSHEKISVFTQLNESLRDTEAIVFAVPSAFAMELLEQIERPHWENKVFISATKGLLPFKHQLINDYIADHGWLSQDKYVAITGPCHAEEVAAEQLSYLTFAGLNESLASSVADVFANAYLRTTSSYDVWGSQLSAVLKNVYAIGAGMAHALGYGDNFLSVYITNCYGEMYKFLHAHFEKVHPSYQHPNFHTSAYLGDLLVTCYSLHSRNRRLGTMLGKGYNIKAASIEMNMIAEGYYAANGVRYLSKIFGLEIPIVDALYQTMYEGLSARSAFKTLESLFK